MDKPSNKFSFDAIGVNVGDKLTFIDGTEVIAEVFSNIDKARKAMEDKGLNTLESYKQALDCDDFQISVSDSFYHISDNEGETWDNFDIVEQELK